jgi:hypothetical protein
MKEKITAIAAACAALITGAVFHEQAHARGHYEVTCVGADGKVKWKDSIKNVVTTQGKNHALDVYLRNQAATASWFVGLISSISYSAVAAGDTAAQINGSNGWTEAGPTNAPNYTGNRQALTVGNAASGGSLAASAASAFPITGAGTVKGCFLVSTSTKDGTTGVLYSAGLFSGGDKVVGNGDTLNVTYTASL